MMRLEWLEDIVAVIETGSFSEAADRRCVTQSAFSRRIRMIEDYVGTELFDRTRKPVQLKATTAAQLDRIRDLARDLHLLIQNLRRADAGTNQIVIASQHAITTSIAPGIVRRLTAEGGLHIRLRSANRDDCYALLMTRQADLVLVYRTADDAPPGRPDFFQMHDLGTEDLIPLAVPDLAAKARGPGALPLIAYPADVFLGVLHARAIAPNLPDGLTLVPSIETALTLAALQLAEAGLGIAWVPRSLCQAALAAGRLTDLSALLPAPKMQVTAIRLAGPKAATEARVWAALQCPP